MRLIVILLTFWLPSAFARVGIEEVRVDHGSCANQLFASDTVEHIFYEAFPRLGTDQGLYRPRRCGDNTAHLLQRLIMSVPKPLQAYALYLRHEMRMVPPVPVYVEAGLMPARAREGNGDPWVFHVMVMIDNGRGERFILDMDYKREPIPIEEYFAAMFPDQKGVDRASKIFLRAIPALDYVGKFQKVGGGSLQKELHELSNTEYPLITARDLIGTIH